MKSERPYLTLADLMPAAPQPPAPLQEPGRVHRPEDINRAVNRLASAVRDLRALGLAGRWRATLRDGETLPTLTIDFLDDRIVQMADDGIYGVFHE